MSSRQPRTTGIPRRPARLLAAGISRSLRNFWRRGSGSPLETDLAPYERLIERIDAFAFDQLSDADLRVRSREIIRESRPGRGEAAHHGRQNGGPATPAHSGWRRHPGLGRPLRHRTDQIDRGSDACESGEESVPPLPRILIPEGPLDESHFAVTPRSHPPDPRLPEVFALVREASRRTIGLDPFRVQMIAGAAMAAGRIAELPTGEGKTLAAVFPAVLHALDGHGVHVLTFNDYLARRDAAWMGPIYEMLGLTAGCAQEGQTPAEKRAAYGRDVTYATAKECGFDYLRDGLAYDEPDLVHRPFHAAIVDEADSILIDEARIPLVIAGAAGRASWDAGRLAALVRRLRPGLDYATDAERRNVFLTDPGAARAEGLLGCGSLYDPANTGVLEALYCALHAEALLRRDVDYIVRGGRIEIIDEYTGRVVEKRHWPDGLQAAVEAREGLDRRSTARVLGQITLQYFFRLYPKLAGMTATARSAADELHRFYGLGTVIVPPHAPSRRVDLPDAVFTHKEAKRRVLVNEIREVHASGRPILVGTASVKESEDLAADLAAGGIECAVLNARNDEAEAAVVAQAGRPGAVTISTNMAGRGTDIKLGGADEAERERAVALGGLYVIGANRHDSLRIDRQLRGRAGRQGDPGSSRFFISLEDDLFERYGLTSAFTRRHRLQPREGELPPGAIHAQIEHAQRVIEGQNFDIRITLAKFSSIVDVHRRIIRDKREEFRKGADAGGTLAALDPGLSDAAKAALGSKRLGEIERRATLFHLDRLWSEHLAWVQDTRESIHLVGLGGRAPFEEFSGWAADEFLAMDAKFATAVIEEVRAAVESPAEDRSGLDRLRGPSSTWTYLVNEEKFGWGLSLVSPRNIGFAAAAAGPLWPLLVLNLQLSKWFGRRKGGSRAGGLS